MPYRVLLAGCAWASLGACTTYDGYGSSGYGGNFLGGAQAHAMPGYMESMRAEKEPPTSGRGYWMSRAHTPVNQATIQQNYATHEADSRENRRAYEAGEIDRKTYREEKRADDRKLRDANRKVVGD